MDALQMADLLEDNNPDCTSRDAANMLRRQYFQIKNMTRVLKESRDKHFKLGDDMTWTIHDCLQNYGEQDGTEIS